MSTKQVIVVRKDLGMRKGKIAAQVAHASMGAILSLMKVHTSHGGPYARGAVYYNMVLVPESPVVKWLAESFTKIVVYVESEEALYKLKEKADEERVLNCLITDSGKTEFHGNATVTCLAVGPDVAHKVDLVTGKKGPFGELPLM